MTTVGYGDYYPITSPGRVLGFVVCVSGVVLLSFTVVTVDKQLTLEPGEARTYNILKRLKEKSKLEVKAANLIAMCWKLKRISRQRNQTKTNILVGEFKRVLFDFNRRRNELRNLYIDTEEDNNEMDRSIEVLNKN